MKFKKKIITNLEDLLKCYSNKEFSSPYRSTIPLIELFFKNTPEMERIIPNYQSYNCVFEYETPIQKGKGKASCSDLMIFNKDRGFCIEAKRTEPAYQLVKDWLYSTNNSDNRELVLSGWLDLINKRCRTKLISKDIENLPYQMIHRFASTCKINSNSELLYFCFELDEKSFFYYKKQLGMLSKLTNKEVLIKLAIFKIKESDNFKILEKQWKLRSGKIDLSDEVQQLMLEEKVMTITIDKIINL